MRKILLVLGVVPLMIGTAMAAQSLTDNQMDGVTAGFEAFSGPTPEDLQVFQALAAQTSAPGPPPPLVSRDNYPPSAFTQPTGQNPFQPHAVVPLNTVNPGGPCICSVP
jgi:hypothetical protein